MGQGESQGGADPQAAAAAKAGDKPKPEGAAAAPAATALAASKFLAAKNKAGKAAAAADPAAPAAKPTDAAATETAAVATAAAEPKSATASAAKAKPAKEAKQEKAAKSNGKGKANSGQGKDSSGKGKGKAQEKGKPQVNRLCIRNLGEDMTQEQLKTLFEAYGPLGSIQVKTKEDGKCRGFAFVTFPNAEQASKAIAEMDKKDIGGKQLSVTIATERIQEGADGDKGKSKGKGSKGEGKDSKGKGKGKKGGGDASLSIATSLSSQQAGYIPPSPYGQQAMYPGFAGYPYNTSTWASQQMYAQYYQQQQQAAQLAQMQQMVQGMYLASLTGSQVGAVAAKPPGPVEKEYIGTLKSISAKRGYGFIQCAEIGKLFPGKEKKDGAVEPRDAYISADLLPQGIKTELGIKLKFTTTVNSKGHPQAKTCSLVV